ncbi:MAG: hypothetical protein NT056_02140, partial [Proteobacteria bacterium]|nr:hypothetical protein [Pseudomonadota bacterium]
MCNNFTRAILRNQNNQAGIISAKRFNISPASPRYANHPPFVEREVYPEDSFIEGRGEIFKSKLRYPETPLLNIS